MLGSQSDGPSKASTSKFEGWIFFVEGGHMCIYRKLNLILNKLLEK